MVRSPRIGLALATGAPEGAIYEIGALRALDEALEGLDFNNLFIYVGVSAGAFLCANLANNLTTAQMCRAIVSPEPGEHPFIPETFFTPHWKAYLRSGGKLPKLLGEALWKWISQPGDHSLLESLMRLSRALPVGLFDNQPIRDYLEKIYNIKGRTNDFRKLGKRLWWWRRSRFRAGGVLRRAGARRRSHLPGRAGERRAARALPGGGDRRPPLCRRRAAEDAPTPRWPWKLGRSW